MQYQLMKRKENKWIWKIVKTIMAKIICISKKSNINKAIMKAIWKEKKTEK